MYRVKDYEETYFIQVATIDGDGISGIYVIPCQLGYNIRSGVEMLDNLVPLGDDELERKLNDFQASTFLLQGNKAFTKDHTTVTGLMILNQMMTAWK